MKLPGRRFSLLRSIRCVADMVADDRLKEIRKGPILRFCALTGSGQQLRIEPNSERMLHIGPTVCMAFQIAKHDNAIKTL